MHALDHMIIRGGGGRRLDIDNQMGCIGLAGLRQMDLIGFPEESEKFCTVGAYE
jgi:hypothetical protein